MNTTGHNKHDYYMVSKHTMSLSFMLITSLTAVLTYDRGEALGEELDKAVDWNRPELL